MDFWDSGPSVPYRFAPAHAEMSRKLQPKCERGHVRGLTRTPLGPRIHACTP